MPIALHSGCYRSENASLAGSEFVDTDLEDSKFHDVNLRGADFSDVALTGAKIRNACLWMDLLSGRDRDRYLAVAGRKRRPEIVPVGA